MEITQASYDVTADTTRNTLYLDLHGPVDRAAAERLAVEAITSARSLEDDFAVVTHASRLVGGSDEVLEPIRRARDELATMGGTAMVSVLDSADAVDPTSGDHDVATVTSMNAAESYVTDADA